MYSVYLGLGPLCLIITFPRWLDGQKSLNSKDVLHSSGIL